MSTTDKAKAIKLLRSIVDIAIGTIQILEGTRAPSLATATAEDELGEAVAVIGGHLDRIDTLVASS